MFRIYLKYIANIYQFLCVVAERYINGGPILRQEPGKGSTLVESVSGSQYIQRLTNDGPPSRGAMTGVLLAGEP